MINVHDGCGAKGVEEMYNLIKKMRKSNRDQLLKDYFSLLLFDAFALLRVSKYQQKRSSK